MKKKLYFVDCVILGILCPVGKFCVILGNFLSFWRMEFSLLVRVCGCHVNKETKMVEKKVISVFGLLKSVDFHRASGMIEVLLKMRMIALA